MILVMQPALAPVSPSFSGGFILKTWLVMFVLIVSLAAQSQKPSAAPKTKSRLATAIDRTLEKGRDAILPPHISDLLGISPEKNEVPVKQAVKMGEPIRGFEVSSLEPNNVVIFVESRLQKETIFYLTSRTGTLRRVLSVREGAGYPRRPTNEDQVAFDQEKQYWIDQLAPKHP